MKLIRNIYYFYLQGFKNMTLGKTLWKIIIIKLLKYKGKINCVNYQR